ARHGGTVLPPANAELPYRHSLFHIELQGEQVQTLWLRVETNNAKIVRPVFWQLPALQQEIQTKTMLAGLFIGGMVCLALASLVLGLLTPYWLHLSCGAYLLMATLNRAAGDGWLSLYVVAIRNQQQDFLIGLSISLSLTLFVRVNLSLMQAPQHLPRLARGFETLAWAIFCLSVLSLLGGQFERLIPFLSAAGLLCLLLMLALGLSLWLWQREPQARWVLLAILPVLLPAIMRMIRNLGLLDSTAWLDGSLHAGLMLHGLLYFLLVSRQQRSLRQQQIIAQTRAQAGEALLLEQRQFMTLLSHELRGPVATLDGALSNLARASSAAAVQPAALATAAPAALEGPRLQRMSRALARLKYVLDYCLSDERLAAMAQQPAAQRPLSAEQIVQEALSQIEPDPRLQMLAPDPISAAPLLRRRVRGDLPLLGAALKNLLENALKYAPTGPVQLTQCLEQRADGAWLLLLVQDQGPGLDAQAQAELFRKFARGRLQAHLAGAGLGLYLAKQIVERHGGDLHIGNAPGGGALARLSLPLLPLPPLPA
ncbi:MAG: hypothetical protein K2W93_18580, partial [Burkholderiaceae bacterium]|nr:hypothetical protein [Burkholderiaceae bacterium]